MLLGLDPDGNLIGIGTDGDGYLIVPIKGLNPSEELATVRVDADGQLYVILRGASGNDVTVDADGFISAVLKGQGVTGLVTVSVDDNGYLQAYILDDESQWGDIIRTGNSELAARLGSPVTWDWRGQVLWWHDFSTGYQGLQKTTAGTGAAISLSPDYARFGGYSAKLKGGTDGDKYSMLTGQSGNPPSNLLGICTYFFQDPTPNYLKLTVVSLASASLRTAAVRYVFSSGDIDYQDSDGNWQTLDSVPPSSSVYQYHSLKVVADFTNEVYVRALFDTQEFTMGQDLYTIAAIGQPDKIGYDVACYADSADNDTCYIDVLILTTSEPA